MCVGMRSLFMISLLARPVSQGEENDACRIGRQESSWNFGVVAKSNEVVPYG